jgi:hypothetical protein
MKYTLIDDFNSLLLIKHEVTSMEDAMKSLKNPEMVNFLRGFVTTMRI